MGKSTNSGGSKLLTIPEVAERLRISIRAVYERVAAGHIRTLKLGRRTTRIEEAEVERYLAEARRIRSRVHQGGR